MGDPVGSKPLFAVLLVLVCAQLIFGFRGAVFEHAQQSYAISSKLPEDIIRENLEYYKTATTVARSKGVDVIVFPEYGVFPPSSRSRLKHFLEFVPDPQLARFNPCTEPTMYSKRPILYTLSCLARENNIIIVANMGDIQPCTKQKGCPKDGVFHFNTNVVFDGNGTILAKYHKEHLFGESGMDLPEPGVQDPTFKTHLGRFATFVCFDIVFGRIVEVAHWKGIDAILFPTMWIDAYPLYNSIHHFQAWAIGNNVPLLAANQHVPGTSSIGSAIFKGNEGALVYTFNPDGQSKLLIADVQKTTGKPNLDSNIYVITKNESKEYKEDGKDVGNACSRKVLKPVKNVYKDYRCQESDMTNFTLTKLESKMDVINSCNNGMCCTLHYSAKDMQENFYFGVSNGSFSALNRYSWAEENCFLARCDGFKNKTCVTFPTRSKTLFYDVHMTANFSTDSVYPTVMSSGLRITPRNHWEFDLSKRRASIAIGRKSAVNLLIVGFKGRPYDRDPPFLR